MVLFTLMPISCAASVSSLTARMALPILVFCTMKARSTMEITATTMVTMTFRLMERPPRLKVTAGMIMVLGKARVLAVQISCARFWRRRDTPMAVISREIRGACRRGL